jgi:hypothetical protein
MDQRRDSNTIADGLGLRPPRTLLVKSPSSLIEISRIVCGSETVGMTSVIPATEAFALGVYQTGIPYHEIWRRGHPVIRQGYAAQSMQLADLADEYAPMSRLTMSPMTLTDGGSAVSAAIQATPILWLRIWWPRCCLRLNSRIRQARFFSNTSCWRCASICCRPTEA